MLAKIGMVLLVVTAQALLLIGLVLYQTGVILVEVKEGGAAGHHLFVPVPVALLHAGLFFVPEKEMQNIRKEIEPRRELILALCSELDNTPDGSFVEYTSEHDRVSVKKEKGDLIVLVNSGEEKVRVEVPVFAVQNLLAQVAR